MKISEITVKDLCNHCRIEFNDLNFEDETYLNSLLSAAISFVKGYTGLDYSTVTGEEVADGDGEETEFYIEHPSVISGTQTIYIDEVEKTETTDYTFDAVKGLITFNTAPASGAEITADYEWGLDAYSDLTIAVFVIVQDLYDNRAYYVDKDNVNKVVETILGMHSINLL